MSPGSLMARSYKWSQSVVCGSSQPRRGQEASPGFPRFHQCFPASSGLRTPAQPSPACPGPQGLAQLFSQPRDGAMRSGTLRDCFQVNPCVFRPRKGQKPQDCQGLFQPLQGPRRDPQASPGCPGNSPKLPRTLDP